MHAPDASPNLPSRLADRLAEAERQVFIGRRSEVDVFRQALLTPTPPFAVLFVHGPGGVGKTALLGEYERIATEAGHLVLRLDGRSINPSPAGLMLALGRRMGIEDGSSLHEYLAARARVVLLIDTYEALAQLDSWLREEFLPQLPGAALTVIAGRNPPASGWRTEPGWRDLVRSVSLRNLRPDEGVQLLAAQGIPDSEHEPVLAFTHGHPLALSLVADVLKQAEEPLHFDPAQTPDIVRLLLDRFIQGVPDGPPRRALEICAHARVTTEDFLAEVLDVEDAHDLFEWLRGLSFIEQGPEGIFPHDLTRDVLDIDLRWRNPERYRSMHARIRVPVLRRVEEARGLEQQRAFFDLIFLHRHNPVMKPYQHWDRLGTVYAEPAQPADHARILELVDTFEGSESARIAAYWLERQPQAFHALRKRAGTLEGFACTLVLDEITATDRSVDPAMEAAQTFARAYGPVREGETLLYQRFHMAADTYQDLAPVMDLMAPISASAWLLTPRLAWSFMAMQNAAAWQQLFAHLNLRLSPAAEFTVGGRQYAVFTHDWRAEPVDRWLDVMGQRELAAESEAAGQTPDLPPALIVLSQPEFAEAVRTALRHFTQPEALAASPLLRSRLLVEFTSGEPTADTLKKFLMAAAGTLRMRPRDERLFRAVHHTYFQPAPTQEQAAELLDLPFSTYRYHLNAAVGRITEWLWQREVSGSST